MFDFNDAPEQSSGSFPIIPNNTFLDCELTIKPGGHDDFALGYSDGLAKKSASGAVYIEAKLKITHPEQYANRVIFDNIGLQSGNPDAEKAKKYTDMGRAKVKAILCSNYGIDPRNISDADKAKLKLTKLAELNNKQVVIKVKESKDQNGNPKNEVAMYITPEHPQYADFRDGYVPASIGETLKDDTINF